MHSLRPYMQNRFENPYHHEAGLTSRLEETVFSELRRRLDYIRTVLPLLQEEEQIHQNLIILHPEPGSCAEKYEGFLSDFCALAQKQQPVQKMHCVGEIKPSHKFQASWGPPSGVLGWGMIGGDATRRSTTTQFRTVMAQVKFYMRTAGLFDDGTAVQYGYVITDEEVMLLKRYPARPRSILVSVGFPLHRPLPQEPWDVGQAIGSGMTVLVLIHLLAGEPNSRVAAIN